jgi:hypothetical protein
MNTKGLTFAKAGVAAAALSFMMMLGGCPTEADPPGDPALTGTVSITGEPKVTKVLTADISALGGTGTPSYVWNRADTSSAAGTEIAGATANTYTLVADDAGKYIKVTVSRSGYTGSKTSAAKGAILASDAVDPTIGTITVSAAEASTYVGGTLQFSAAVTVTGSDDPYYQTVTWTVAGGAAGTSISADGLLTVMGDETVGDSLTITATSTFDDTVNGTKTVSVTAVPTVDSVAINETSVSVALGATQQFTATVNGTNAPQAVTWSISSTGHKPGTTITSPGGVLTVATNETLTSLTVKATSTFDTTKSGTTTVTVLVPTVTGVTVSPATADVAPGGNKTFTATVNGDNSPPQTVTWSLTSGGTGTTAINPTTGVLTVDANQALSSTLTVKATSTFNTGKSGTATVTVSVVKPSGTVKMEQAGNNKFTLTLTGLTWKTDLSDNDEIRLGSPMRFVGAVTANGADNAYNPAITDVRLEIMWNIERTSDTKATITLSQYVSGNKKYWGAGKFEMMDLTKKSDGNPPDGEGEWDMGVSIAQITAEGQAYYDYMASQVDPGDYSFGYHVLNGVVTEADGSEQVDFNILKAN